jgi:hypothetical protein
MTNQNDDELLKRWLEWLKALDAEMCSQDQREAERRHKLVEIIQQSINTTPSRGLTGIGVKLALAAFLEGFDDGADGESARSAYRDTARLLNRDFLAEAEAIVARSREREITLQEQPLLIWGPARKYAAQLQEGAMTFHGELMHKFPPDVIDVLTRAFEDVWTVLAAHHDPGTECEPEIGLTVGRTLVSLAADGITDRQELRRRALETIALSPQ